MHERISVDFTSNDTNDSNDSNASKNDERYI